MSIPSEKSIVLVEDDQTLREMLAYNLEQEGYTVAAAADGLKGLELVRSASPNLVIVDIMLPELDGLTLCRMLRREMEVLIIILSARSTEVDKIIGLDSGADDYIAKPFGLGEFLARVRAVLRRQPKPRPSERLEAGDLSLNLIARRSCRGEQTLDLSHKEFDLLAELMRNQGMVLSRDWLLTKIWGYDEADKSRTVDVHIRWLRTKIEENPAKPKRIITIPKSGYRFEG